MQATGTTLTCIGIPSWFFRLTVRIPSNSLTPLPVFWLMVETSETNISANGLFIISSFYHEIIIELNI